MIEIGKGGQRQVKDVKLSRYACYLIVQNGDPAKPVIANGQTYFAIQTRRQELSNNQAFQQLKEDEKRLFLRNELREHNKQLVERNKLELKQHTFRYFPKSWLQRALWRLDAKGIHQHKELKKARKF